MEVRESYAGLLGVRKFPLPNQDGAVRKSGACRLFSVLGMT